ncbi:MAG TPA: hypothetical protein VFG35_04140, partial [Actinoplanes sp.]|nr:hypothetical protein [Actinoplanes sp.]
MDDYLTLYSRPAPPVARRGVPPASRAGFVADGERHPLDERLVGSVIRDDRPLKWASLCPMARARRGCEGTHAHF